MSPSFLKIGHRGAKAYEPENTLASIQKAIELNCDMIEVDVHLCKTGELVVIHDDSVDRTTNGTGKISELSLKEIKKLNAGNGQQIPTLKVVIDLVLNKTKLNIEIKGTGVSKALVKLMKQYLKKGVNANMFYVSSFNHVELLLFKKMLPQIKTGALIYHLPYDLAQIGVNLGVYSINVSYEFLTQELVDDAHLKHLKIFVYTVNNYEDINWVRSLGVDGIFSDYPDRLSNEFITHEINHDFIS